MGCGAAEATGLGFVCFVVINPCVLSKLSNFTPYQFHSLPQDIQGDIIEDSQSDRMKAFIKAVCSSIRLRTSQFGFSYSDRIKLFLCKSGI